MDGVRVMPKTAVLTPEGKQKLESELNYLRTVRRREVAERIHQAMEFTGDPVDNAEYQDAKNEQARVEGRILEIENILANAIIIQQEEAEEPDVVRVGSRVTVIDETGERDTFVIVGSTEANPLQGRVSLDSPVGQALLGRRRGETVTVHAPAGLIRYTIMETVPPSSS
jgi:transcription elongation factor GreA